MAAPPKPADKLTPVPASTPKPAADLATASSTKRSRAKSPASPKRGAKRARPKKKAPAASAGAATGTGTAGTGAGTGASAAGAAAGAGPATPAGAAIQRAYSRNEATSNTISAGLYTDPPPRQTLAAAGDRPVEPLNVYNLSFYKDYSGPTPLLASSVTLPYVNKITVSAPNSVIRTRSLDGAVYAEHAGFIQRTLVLEGRSGSLRGLAGDSPSAASSLDIHKFTQLRNFLETYAQYSSANKNALLRGTDTQLILSCSFEDEQFFCDVVDFQYRRTAATSSLSFEYTITLITNSFMGRGGDSIPIRPNKEAFFSDAELAAAAAAHADWNIARFNAGIGESALRRRSSMLAYAADLVRSSSTAIVDLASSLTCSEIYDLRLGVAAANNEINRAAILGIGTVTQRTDQKLSLAAMSSTIDMGMVFKGGSAMTCPTPIWSEWYYGTINPIASTILMLAIRERSPGFVPQVQEGESAGLPYRPAFSDAIYTPPTTGQYVDATLSDGQDNAYDIAAWWFGNPDLYWRVILANNLRDAYTRDDGTRLAPGSTIKLPDVTKPAVRDNDILGTDLLIVEGDLQLAGNSDVQRVSGYANFAQNLTHRMRTERGSNKVFPQHGLRAGFIGGADSSIVAELSVDVRTQIKQDHRTDRVERLQLTELGDKVAISVLVTPITGNASQFNFNYTFTDGERA